MKSHLQQPVLRIMFLAASGANRISAPRRALTIVVFGNGKRGAAAARDEEHAEWAGVACLGWFAAALHVRPQRPKPLIHWPVRRGSKPHRFKPYLLFGVS